MLNMNYFEIIKDDVRNFRKLNNYQMEYIKDLTNDEKNELFNICNDCIGLLKSLI